MDVQQARIGVLIGVVKVVTSHKSCSVQESHHGKKGTSQSTTDA